MFRFTKQLINQKPNQTVILDGGALQKEPWKEMKRLKDKIGLEPFFYEKRFGKREDGFWCVKKNTNSDAADNLVCMPETVFNVFFLQLAPSPKFNERRIKITASPYPPPHKI